MGTIVPVNADALFVCSAAQFHEQVEAMVDDAERDCLGLTRDDLRASVLQVMLAFLMPAGNA